MGPIGCSFGLAGLPFLKNGPRYSGNQDPFGQFQPMDLEIGPQYGEFAPRFVQWEPTFLGLGQIEVRPEEMDLEIGEIDLDFHHNLGLFR